MTSPTASADRRRRIQFAPQPMTPMTKSIRARVKVAGVTGPSAIPWTPAEISSGPAAPATDIVRMARLTQVNLRAWGLK